MKHLSIVLALLGSMAFTNAGLAHHSSAPHFDNTKEVSVTGTVTRWAFVNPHAYIYLDVTDEMGEVHNWRCESSSATALGKNGYTKETFIPGQEITVVGSPARREDYHCGLTSFIFPDGTKIARNQALPEDKRQGELPEVIATDIEREEYLPNGQPNISGYWVRAGRGGPPSARIGLGEAGAAPSGAPAGGGGGRGPQIELTAAGQAELDKYEQIYDDPSIQCDIGNIFFGWTHDGHVNQITQEDDKIILQYGYMDFVRTIYLNMDEHPANIVPSRGGHSIGHWEDKTLVVDTTGFTQGVLFPLGGHPNSDQMHSVEKFWYDPETKTLNHSYVATDPLFLVGEYTGQDTMAVSAQPYEPYNCTELSGDNNRRPEDRVGS